MMLPPAPIAPRATHYCDTLETLRRRIVPGVVLSNNAGRFPDDPTFPLWLGRRIANPRRDRCRSDGTLRPFARATAISWSTMDLVDGIGRPVVSTPTMRPTGSALCVVGRGRSLALCGRPLLENGRPRLVTYLWAVPHEGEPPAARKTHTHTHTHTHTTRQCKQRTACMHPSRRSGTSVCLLVCGTTPSASVGPAFHPTLGRRPHRRTWRRRCCKGPWSW